MLDVANDMLGKGFHNNHIVNHDGNQIGNQILSDNTDGDEGNYDGESKRARMHRKVVKK